MIINSVYYDWAQITEMLVSTGFLLWLLCWSVKKLIQCRKEKKKEQALRSISVKMYSEFLEDSEAFEAYRQMLEYAAEQSGVTDRNASEKDG